MVLPWERERGREGGIEDSVAHLPGSETYHEDPPVSVPVNGPQPHIRLSLQYTGKHSTTHSTSPSISLHSSQPSQCVNMLTSLHN